MGFPYVVGFTFCTHRSQKTKILGYVSFVFKNEPVLKGLDKINLTLMYGNSEIKISKQFNQICIFGT